VPTPHLYSYLTAATGSIRDARRTGTYAASDPIKRIATAELDKMSGSTVGSLLTLLQLIAIC
jgi:hypothetical protein